MVLSAGALPGGTHSINAALRTVSVSLAKSTDLDVVLDAVVVEVTTRLGADASHMALYDDDNDAMRTVAGVVHGAPIEYEFPAVIQASTSGCYAVLKDRTTPRYFDLDAEPENFWPGTVEFHREFGSRAVLCAPLRFGDRFAGYLAVAFLEHCRLTPEQLAVMEALCQQAAIVAELIRAGRHDRMVAIAREREDLAHTRAQELETAATALQRTIDATAALQSLEQFIPEALRIVAEAFDVTAAGYFEQSADVIRLRFWLDGGTIVGPEKLPHVDGDDLDRIRYVAGGFTVPPEYLGVHYRYRNTPSIIHHTDATASPELHAFCRGRGWDWELNVPLVVNGVAQGAVCLYRPGHEPFTAGDVSLGQTLGKQIALAMEASRVAERERHAAVATERAAELAHANAVLSRSVTDATSEETTDVLIGRMILAIGELTEAPDAALMVLDPDGSHLTMPVLTLDGLPADRLVGEFHPMWGEIRCDVGDFPGMQGLWRDELFAEDFDVLAPLLWPPSLPWHRARGHTALVMVPLRHGSRTVGIIGLGYREAKVLDDRTVELVRALADQISLVIALDQAASKAREADVLREREHNVRERADMLARANAALSRSTAELVSNTTLPEFLTAVLVEAITAAGAVSGVVFLHDAVDDTLSPKAFIVRGEVIDVATDPSAKAYREPQPAADSTWDILAKEQRILVLDYDDPPSVDSPKSRAFHRAHGHRWVAAAPMMYAGNTIGFLGLCYDKSVDARPDEGLLELAWVLTQQATLAVRLTTLAEEARSAAVDVERGRVAGEIHDGLAQGFTAIVMQARAAMALLADGRTDWSFLRRIEALAADGLAEARRSVFALRSVTLERDGLLAAITRLADNSAISGQLRCTVHSDDEIPVLPPAVEDAAYRIVQEGIQNALKHAEAQAIVVRLNRAGNEFTVSVEDDGNGISEDLLQRARETGGLRAMRERAAAVRGRLTVTHRVPRGTIVTVDYQLDCEDV